MAVMHNLMRQVFEAFVNSVAQFHLGMYCKILAAPVVLPMVNQC